MDRRIVFVLVFLFTLLSTVLVSVTSLLSGQSLMHTVIYSLVTMWLVGIVSELLLSNLYSGIVRPLEEEEQERKKEKEMEEINLEQVEEVEVARDRLKEVELTAVAGVEKEKSGDEF